ncbi:MAG TPA: SufS family cysteine desulfurase [Gemmatimonadales bacterium]|jgi:cysteine desulfurase/selenocysteine lyase
MTAAAAHPLTASELHALRAVFPALHQLARGKPLVYLDSAATAQKPLPVIDALDQWYRHDNANIHRGVYQLSEGATAAWDDARDVVGRFIGAASADEIVFVRGTTEAINLVAQSFLRPRIGPDGWVLVTELEHHANIVPWQLAGARTVPVPVTDAGELDLEAAGRLLQQRPALFACTHISNVLGTVVPVAELCHMAKLAGVPVLLDGAQAAPHIEIDVSSIGCDFYCFSGHKLFGPTGIGVLWAAGHHLDAMPPWQGGGDMIDLVTFERTTYADAPRRFEAGTPHIAGAIGLAAAIRWIESQDRRALAAHEAELLAAAIDAMGSVPGVRLHGPEHNRAAVLTFTIDGAHPHDVASLLDGDGIAVRAGHHCAQPLHRRLGLGATIRASFAPYNTLAEVDLLAAGVARAAAVLS